MKILAVVFRGCMLLCAVTTLSFGGQQNSSKSALPVEPIAAVIEGFRSHAIVALGDNHGNEQGHVFRLSLIRDPRFAVVVNDIVVEFGNARYQDVMDRFVRGEEVPYESLRQVWQNTTQVEYDWELPIYADFFRAVRAVNQSLPPERRLRVLLGDPPIDWDTVHTLEDLRKSLNRDAHAVDVIRREVLSKGRRALVIYGDEHLARSNPGGIVAQLEKDGATKVFNIHTETRFDLKTLQADVTSWPKPSLTMLRGTLLGMAGRPVPMEDQFDALLYLGPPSAMTRAQLSPALCADRAWMEMRASRLALIPPPPGAPFDPVERLKQYCARPGGHEEIADNEPKITKMIRQVLVDAAQGKVDPALIAPESRDRLVPFLQNNGPRFLGTIGSLQSLTLIGDTTDDGKRIRRYRAAYSSSKKIILTVWLSSSGTIISLDPRPE